MKQQNRNQERAGAKMVALSKLVISALTALIVVNFSALPYSPPLSLSLFAGVNRFSKIAA